MKSYVRRSHVKIAALKFEEMRVERFWKKGLGRNLSLNLTSRTVQPDKSLTPRPHSAQLSPDRMVQVCQPKKVFNDLNKFICVLRNVLIAFKTLHDVKFNCKIGGLQTILSKHAFINIIVT